MPIFTQFTPQITTVTWGAVALPTGVETVLSFGSINIDQTGIASLAVPGQLTMPANGGFYLWDFGFWAGIDGVGGTGTYWARSAILRDGAYVGRNMSMYNIDAFQKFIECHSIIYRVAAGSVITFTVRQDSGATRNIVAGGATARLIGVNR